MAERHRNSRPDAWLGATSRCQVSSQTRAQQPPRRADATAEAVASDWDDFCAEGSLAQPPSIRGGATDLGQDMDMYSQLSQLVDELQAARWQASVAPAEGSQRAIEVATVALEPLLKLRDAAGAAASRGESSDLAMPWLPQLLDSFRNVLRSAVGGAALPGVAGKQHPHDPRSNADAVGSCPTFGGGVCGLICGNSCASTCSSISGMEGGAEEDAGTRTDSDCATGDAGGVDAIVAVLQAISTASAQEIHRAPPHEKVADATADDERQWLLDGLRKQEARELGLLRELEELRRDRDGLLLQVQQLETPRQGGADEGSAGHDEAEEHQLARRVADLEREGDQWRSERKRAEEQLESLVGVVRDAIETPVHRVACQATVAPESPMQQRQHLQQQQQLQAVPTGRTARRSWSCCPDSRELPRGCAPRGSLVATLRGGGSRSSTPHRLLGSCFDGSHGQQGLPRMSSPRCSRPASARATARQVERPARLELQVRRRSSSSRPLRSHEQATEDWSDTGEHSSVVEANGAHAGTATVCVPVRRRARPGDDSD